MVAKDKRKDVLTIYYQRRSNRSFYYAVGFNTCDRVLIYDDGGNPNTKVSDDSFKNFMRGYGTKSSFEYRFYKSNKLANC